MSVSSPAPEPESPKVAEFRLGDWLVRPDVLELERDGEIVRVEPKAMQVLCCLAKRPGDLVTKDEIYTAVWHDAFISDQVLPHIIWQLRRTLGNDSIGTVSRRGYRLLAPVSPAVTSEPLEEAKPQQTAGARKLWRAVPFWARAVIAAAVLTSLSAGIFVAARILRTPRIESVAVLPLSNFSGDPDQQYLSDGLTEELTTALSRIRSLRVISRTSAMRYRDVRKSVPQIARELGVDAVIEGSVQRSGDRVRITVQLIHARSERHLWAESYERQLGDALALREEIALAIAGAVKARLSSEDRLRFGHQREINAGAYEAYLKGREELRKPDYKEATKYFEEAVQRDPQFALAHALLAHSDAMATAAPKDASLSSKFFEGTARALELEPDLSEAHVNVGDLKFFAAWDWSAGEAEFKRAVELDPGSVDAREHYVYAVWIQGKLQTATQEMKVLLSLDPLSPTLNYDYGRLLLDSQQYEAALSQLSKAVELDPNIGQHHFLLALAYQHFGRTDEALRQYLEAFRLFGSSGEELSQMQDAYRVGGLHSFWECAAEALEKKSRKTRVPPYTRAVYYLRAGQNEKALDLLEEAFREHSVLLTWVKVSSTWMPLHSNPRFIKLLKDMNLPSS